MAILQRFAGAPFEVGRSRDRMVQPMTLMFLMEGFVLQRFRQYVLAHPDQWHGVQGLTALMQEATAKGELKIPRENILLFGNVHEGHVLVNSTRILNTLGTDVWDLTRAELEGRRQVAELTSFFRKYVPGFEKAYVQQSGITTCVRESRRIMGEYVLTAKDVLDARQIRRCYCTWAVILLIFIAPLEKERFLRKSNPVQLTTFHCDA